MSQATTALLLLTAFVLDTWPLAAAVGAVNLLGAAVPPLAFLAQVYRRVLKPLGLVKPHIVLDNPEPHRFAQTFSGVVTGLGAGLVWAGISAGWALSWLVIVLAALNVFVGFCAGCFTYYQLSRLGVPGFSRRPVAR